MGCSGKPYLDHCQLRLRNDVLQPHEPVLDHLCTSVAAPSHARPPPPPAARTRPRSKQHQRNGRCWRGAVGRTTSWRAASGRSDARLRPSAHRRPSACGMPAWPASHATPPRRARVSQLSMNAEQEAAVASWF
jgi:hypothetical protein